MNFKYLCISILGVTILNIACDNTKGTVTNLTPSTSTSPSTSPTGYACESPTTKIIDYGRRVPSGTTTLLRGAFSDVALNPSNYPAVVFTDAGAVALKYVYWNGTTFKTEIIAGGLTTNFVKLVFLPSGIPLVFWANAGTGIFMAVRSTASTSAEGTWTVSTLEDVATHTTRAVEASVNPSGQVAIFYVSAATTSARVILCSANCESASSYTGMGAVGNFITSTASASNNSADVKWCNAGGGTYYPYVVYGGTANSIIARCNNATLSNCLTPGNWSTATITDGVNATGANQVMTKLQIDSTADSPFYIVARRTSTEIRAYKQTAANGCATGALTIDGTSTQVVASATIGNAFGSLSRDTSNRWHLMVNDSTTAVKYYNELTGTITAAWNTVGTVDTTTLLAAGATRGGMVIDQTNDQVLATYGRAGSGVPVTTYGNLVLAFNQCPSGGTGCGASTLASASSAAGMSFGNLPLEATGQMLIPTSGQYANTVVTQATSAGIPIVAYVDFSGGTQTTGRIKYAVRNGSSVNDTWVIHEIEGTTSAASIAFVLDSNDKPWIAYYDPLATRYYLLSNSMTDGTDTWRTFQFPIVIPAGGPSSPSMNNVALALNYSGLVEKPVMIVTNSHAGQTKTMRAAIFDPTVPSWSSNTVLDSSGTNNFGGLSVDYDSLGNIVIAYYDTGAPVGIRYNYSTNGGSTWGTYQLVNSLIGGQGLMIRLNPVTHKPAMAWFDRANNSVRYKYCTTSADQCTNSANWSDVGTGFIETAAGVSGFTTTVQDAILNAALTFTSDGTPWVIYPTGAASSNASLMYSYLNSSTGLFTTPATIGPLGTNSNFTTSPLTSSAVNFAVGGWMPHSVRSSLGALHTAYVGRGNYLYVTSCGD